MRALRLAGKPAAQDKLPRKRKRSNPPSGAASGLPRHFVPRKDEVPPNRHALGTCTAVTSAQSPTLNSWLVSRDYTLIMNDNPDAGLSHSIALAAHAAINGGADALLICLADMPFVPPEHLRALAGALAHNIIASSNGITAMPPAIFPRETFEKLTKLTGDSGARSLLDLAIPLPVDPEWLIDIDTRADLAQHLKSHPKR